MTGKLALIEGKLELVKVGEGFMSTGCGKQGSTVITVSHKGKRYETEQFSLVSPTSSFVQPLFTHQSHDLSRTSKSCLLATFNFKVVTIKELGHLLLHHLPLSPPPKKSTFMGGYFMLHYIILISWTTRLQHFHLFFSEMFFFPFFFIFFKSVGCQLTTFVKILVPKYVHLPWLPKCSQVAALFNVNFPYCVPYFLRI